MSAEPAILPDPGNVWEGLADTLDRLAFRPRLAPHVEVARFAPKRAAPYAIAANGRDLVYLPLSIDEADVVGLMDGHRRTVDLAEGRHLPPDQVVALVQSMHELGFLSQRFHDVPAMLHGALHPPRRLSRAAQALRTLTVEWHGAEPAVVWLHRHGLRLMLTRLGRYVAALLCLAGLAAFVATVTDAGIHIRPQSAGVGVAIIVALDFVIIAIHELGHAVLLVHYGRRVKSAGFHLYFGSPAFFIDSSDALMLDHRRRATQAAAGPYFEAVAAGAASVAVWAFPNGPGAPLLHQFVILNYFVLLMNLVPLLELDGYWILSDTLQLRDLRPRSLAFVRSEMWRRLRRRQPLNRTEVALAAYGVLGIAFTIFCVYSAVIFWRRTFGDLVHRLWTSGPAGIVLLMLLALFLAAPALSALAQLIRFAASRFHTLTQNLRFRLERRWRIDAAELLDASPMLDDLPLSTLNELAGRFQRRSYAAGQTLVRQGEKGQAFFLVRGGTVEVVEERRDGTIKPLRLLSRGATLGELALLDDSPRSATVRALGRTDVVHLDRGTFQRLLASHVRPPKHPVSLAQLAELGSLACFAHLDTEQLAELLHHGRWLTAAPGRDVVVEGQHGDCFYAIASGQLTVSILGRYVRTLGAGQFFGELALLGGTTRTATVTAITPARLFEVDRPGFDSMVRARLRGGLPCGPTTGLTWNH